MLDSILHSRVMYLDGKRQDNLSTLRQRRRRFFPVFPWTQ